MHQSESNQSMFKKISEKLEFDSNKTKVSDDVNAFKESEKKNQKMRAKLNSTE